PGDGRHRPRARPARGDRGGGAHDRRAGRRPGRLGRRPSPDGGRVTGRRAAGGAGGRARPGVIGRGAGDRPTAAGDRTGGRPPGERPGGGCDGLGALLLDFDGLLLDTETCTWVAVGEIFEEHGEELDVSWWR